jgi:DNA-binding PadR family transcriptional regulator
MTFESLLSNVSNIFTTQKVLGNLVRQGLLREIAVPDSNRSRRRYEITEKGLNVLAYFEGAEALLDIGGITSRH